jgi:hypothetical protein
MFSLNLLLSGFAMLILVKIKWHIKSKNSTIFAIHIPCTLNFNRSCALFSWCRIKNIFRLYHIRIIAKKSGSHDMKQTDSSIIIVRNVCMLTSVSMIVYLFFTRLWSACFKSNMFPTTRNLQIRVHVYRPRHYCGDWLAFGCFVLKYYFKFQAGIAVITTCI